MWRRLAAAILVVAAASSCGHRSNPNTPGMEPAADFALTDVNPNSSTASQKVSPRQFQGKISAWNFGHAT